MFHALQIKCRTAEGVYATVTQMLEPWDTVDLRAYIRKWALENLPEGAQILAAVVGWMPRPTVELVQRRLARFIQSQREISIENHFYVRRAP